MWSVSGGLGPLRRDWKGRLHHGGFSDPEAFRISGFASSGVQPFGTHGGNDMFKKTLGVLAAVTVSGMVGGSHVRLGAQTPRSAEKAAQSATPLPTISEKTTGIDKLPGYFNLYWDSKQGKLWLEIDKWGTEFLYQSGLPAGLGSNDIGLDRGQLGATRVVRFDRSGPKVLLVEENLEYRAVSQDPDERRAVHDSFAESALWGFTAAAEEKDRALVDATDFFLRDAHHVPEALRQTKQGAYR